MRLFGSFLLTAVFLAAPTDPTIQAAEELSETEKIEALIGHIASLAEAKFVRNDVEYDANTAAKFLRGKWEAKKSDIETAEDFIEKAASVSSTTGKPYLIRFKDGKEVKSGDYLRGELEKIEAK